MIGSMFDSYEAQFLSTCNQVSAQLDSLTSTPPDTDTSSAIVDRVEKDLEGAVKLLRQMEIESRTSGSNIKEKKQKVAQFGQQVQQLRAQLQQLRQTKERSELFQGGGDSGVPSQEAKRFGHVTDRMERQTETLLESRRTLAETEEVAMGITENLDSNRQSILSAHEKVHVTGGFIGQSQSILRRMQLRESRRKIMVYAVFVLLAITFIIIIYLAFFR